MERTEAQKLALTDHGYTYFDLKKLIDNADTKGVSNINKNTAKKDTIQRFKEWFNYLEKKNLNLNKKIQTYTVASARQNKSIKDKVITTEGLIFINILNECG